MKYYWHRGRQLPPGKTMAETGDNYIYPKDKFQNLLYYLMNVQVLTLQNRPQ